MKELLFNINKNWTGVSLDALINGPHREELLSMLKYVLKFSASWDVSKRSDGITIQNGFLPYSPIRAYRSTVEIPAEPRRVAEVIADKAVEYLPMWNREFMEGEVLQTLQNEDNSKSWIHRVRYRTPPLLKNREYLYYMAKEISEDGSVIIAYVSIEDPNQKIGRGSVRGLLYPTVHLCEPLEGNKTVLKHILANNLGGAFIPFVQNTLLTRALSEANLRDSLSQRILFKQLRPD